MMIGLVSAYGGAPIGIEMERPHTVLWIDTAWLVMRAFQAGNFYFIYKK